MKHQRTATVRQTHRAKTTSPRRIQSGRANGPGRANGRRFLLIMLAFAAVLIVGWGQCARTRVSGAGTANLIFALTTSHQLLRFSGPAPGALIGSPLTVTGLVAGDTLVGIDFRPATGQLNALGVNGANARLYVIDPGSGAATQIGETITPPQSAGVFAGADFGSLGVNTSNEVGFDIAADAPGSAYASLTVGGVPGFTRSIWRRERPRRSGPASPSNWWTSLSRQRARRLSAPAPISSQSLAVRRRSR